MKLRDKVQDFGALKKPVQLNDFFIKHIKKRTCLGVRFRNMELKNLFYLIRRNTFQTYFLETFFEMFLDA